MEFLPTLWFILIAVLWIGYLFLEGFDLGVGMLFKSFAKNERDRRVMLNTIGPVWDGNEVWLLTAGGATFAAFPNWYAGLFSGLYLPLTLALLALILRGVSIEYRGKTNSASGRAFWDWCMAGGSFLAAFCVGAMLALTSTGLPLDAQGNRVGHAFVWLNWYAVLGGIAVVLFSYVHGLTFVALKTDGDIRRRAEERLARMLPWALIPIAAWAVVVVIGTGTAWAWAPLVLAVLAALTATYFALKRREGWTFIALGLTLVTGVAAIFGSMFPNVLPSTIDSAFNLTIYNASSTENTLLIMSIVAAIGVPITLAYQSYTYWVFRKRISAHHIPPQHFVTSVV